MPRKPVSPTDPNKKMIGGLYNGMIAGLVPGNLFLKLRLRMNGDARNLRDKVALLKSGLDRAEARPKPRVPR